jgi:hypothetical protein
MTERVSQNLEQHEQVLVQDFVKAFKQMEYYGTGHRIAQAALDQLFETFQAFLNKEEELIYEITPSQIFLNQKSAEKEDLQVQTLAEGLYKKGISGLRIVTGVTRESLDNFLSALTLEVLPPQGDEFWNLPGLTVWGLILKEKPAEEEKKEEDDEAALRALVREMLSPAAPPDLSPEEEVLDWAAQNEKHLVRAIERLLQEQKPPEDSPAYLTQAKALSSFLSGINRAYQILLPQKQKIFLENIALAMTETDQWERLWFSELDKEGTTLFKVYYHLLNPGQRSQVIVLIILSLMNKGSRLVTFLKQCEGELTENRDIMPEIKAELEKAVQDHSVQFADLWSMVQGIFLDEDERQFMDDQYMKQLAGFSEMLSPINWEEESIPSDLKLAYEKVFPLEGTEKTISYLLEFLISSSDIQDLIYWIKEIEGIVQELSLSGDYRQLAMIFQEVSKAIASLPFHHDPSFPEVQVAWEKLCQMDLTEMILNCFPSADPESMPSLAALLPFLSAGTLTNLLRHLQEITPPSENKKFFDFLLSGGKKILPPLLSLLKDNPKPAFINKAFLIITHFQAEEAVPLIPDLLSALSGSEQVQGIKTLAGLKVPELGPLFLPFLKKRNDSQRSEIIRDLLLKENAPVLWSMLKILHTGSLLSRYSTLSLEEKLIRALGQARYEPAAVFCHSILMERDILPLEAYRKIKEAAGFYLREIGTAEAKEWLDQGKHSKNKLTRKICQTILGDR